MNIPTLEVQELFFDYEYTDEDYMQQAAELELVPTYSVSYKQMKQNALEAGWAVLQERVLPFRTILHNAVFKPHHKINNMTKAITWSTL